MKKYILNTPVLTNYGVYRFEKMSLEEARLFARDAVSAVGHKGTAEALSKILGIPVHVNRAEILMQPGDEALIFRILRRLPEGAVLDSETTLRLPYELGRLIRIA